MRAIHSFLDTPRYRLSRECRHRGAAPVRNAGILRLFVCSERWLNDTWTYPGLSISSSPRSGTACPPRQTRVHFSHLKLWTLLLISGPYPCAERVHELLEGHLLQHGEKRVRLLDAWSRESSRRGLANPTIYSCTIDQGIKHESAPIPARPAWPFVEQVELLCRRACISGCGHWNEVLGRATDFLEESDSPILRQNRWLFPLVVRRHWAIVRAVVAALVITFSYWIWSLPRERGRLKLPCRIGDFGGCLAFIWHVSGI